MRTAIERRVAELERAGVSASTAAVVVYDLATGRPLRPVPTGATVVVWLPDNRRGEDDGRESPGCE